MKLKSRTFNKPIPSNVLTIKPETKETTLSISSATANPKGNNETWPPFCMNCENLAKNLLYLENLLRDNYHACKTCQNAVEFLTHLNQNVAYVLGPVNYPEYFYMHQMQQMRLEGKFEMNGISNKNQSNGMRKRAGRSSIPSIPNMSNNQMFIQKVKSFNSNVNQPKPLKADFAKPTISSMQKMTRKYNPYYYIYEYNYPSIMTQVTAMTATSKKRKNGKNNKNSKKPKTADQPKEKNENNKTLSE